MKITPVQHRAWYITHCARRRQAVDETATRIFINRMLRLIRDHPLDGMAVESLRVREFNKLQKEIQ